MTVTTENGVSFERIELADSFFKRLRGLLGRKSLCEGGGLLLKNCNSIHCFFMNFTIDVVYIDKNGVIVGLETVKPWHIGGRFPGAHDILELAEGASEKLSPGMKISIFK